MTPADAAGLVRGWFLEHVSRIERTLSWYGVRSVDDRADLAQNVLLAGYLALLRGERIDNPRAWLRECARKHASNYRRKGLRRSVATFAEVINTMPTPEQIVEHRELLRHLFDGLDEEAQAILLDARLDQLTWEEIARERGISVDRARYLFRHALAQMEEALAKEESTSKAQHAFVLPLALEYVFDAVRADADAASAELRHRIWESLEQRMGAASAGEGEPDREQASSQRPSPTSIPITSAAPPSISAGATAGLAGGGIVLGVLLGHLIHGAYGEKPLATSTRVDIAPVLALDTSASRPGSVDVPATLLTGSEAARTPEEPPAALPDKGKSTPPASPPKAASRAASTMLLERARALFAAGEVQAALQILASPASRGLRGLAAEGPRQLQQRICATPEARGALECADAKPGAAVE
jgi:RNA polymerase sigma factor (sigma-70 family)